MPSEHSSALRKVNVSSHHPQSPDQHPAVVLANVTDTEGLLKLVSAAVSAVLHLGVLATAVEPSAGELFAGDLRVFALLSLALSIAMRVVPQNRWPRVLLAIRLVLYSIAGGTFAAPSIPAALLLAALASDAGSCFSFPWNLLAVLAVAVVGVSGEFIPSTLQPGRTRREDFLPLLPVPGAVAGLAILLRTLSDQLATSREHSRTLDDAVIQLTSANSGFLRYASNAERESAQEERRHITRELHDIVGQTLTDVISMMDASIRNPMDTADQQKRLHQWVRDQSQRCLRETREVLYRLRSMPDAPLSGTAAIKNLVDTFIASTGVDVRLEWSNTPVDLGPQLNAVYYRVVQEALVNAFRHGRATEVLVDFWLENRLINVVVEDNGRGSVDAKKGIGQAGMEERVRNLRGWITFRSTATGYQVHACCPYTGPHTYEATADSPR